MRMTEWDQAKFEWGLQKMQDDLREWEWAEEKWKKIEQWQQLLDLDKKLWQMKEEHGPLWERIMAEEMREKG